MEAIPLDVGYVVDEIDDSRESAEEAEGGERT
jgi:hypothetical protein